jgi:hypothetical protein
VAAPPGRAPWKAGVASAPAANAAVRRLVVPFVAPNPSASATTREGRYVNGIATAKARPADTGTHATGAKTSRELDASR